MCQPAGMDLREKIGYLINRFDDTTPAENRTRDTYLQLTDAIMLLILATPEEDVAQAIGAAIPAGGPGPLHPSG